MLASLRALLFEIIDYAGLFPPAKLPLDQAIRNFARYRQEPEAWMLGRFICPVGQLKVLEPFIGQLFLSGPPLSLSVLGTATRDKNQFLATLQSDLDASVTFWRRNQKVVNLEGFEVRLPDEIIREGCPEAVASLVESACALCQAGSPVHFPFYFEAGVMPDWRQSLNAIIAGLGMNQENGGGHKAKRSARAGFKLRCGGVEASAFPGPEVVACALATCQYAGVPMKATAGLHYAVRRFDATVGTKMHGFLNVFGAGVLARHLALSEERLLPIIADENVSNFRFDTDGFCWKDLRVDSASITAARKEGFVSFGSCSFDEPREDLRNLGLLP